MKNQIFKLILLSILTATYFSCSSDDSDGCNTIICQNGGTFVDCACECPQGFTGSDCSNQVIPTSISIDKVTVRLFPSLNGNGAQWDDGIGNEVRPDLYFQLINSQSTIIYDSPVFYENANVANDHVFNLGNPIVITNFSQPYIVSLFDFDTVGQDDNMASDAFFIYEDGNGFPSVISILDTEQPIAVDLEVSYQF